MSKREAPAKEIELFFSDVNLLIDIEKLTPNQIGNEMPRVGGANFSGYLAGRKTITPGFLTKFYKAWGTKLDKLKHKQYSTNDSGGAAANEEDHAFGGGKGTNGPGDGERTVWESNRILAEANKIAAEANKIAAEANRLSNETSKGLMEANKQLLEILWRFGIPPQAPTGQ